MPHVFLVLHKSHSYVYDEETGLYYLQSRYYNPEIGRFINADALVSTGQGLLGNNMFAYCRNNPVKRKDVSGTEDICVTSNEDNNPFNDLGTTGGGGGSSYGGGYSSGYVYGVDFSPAQYSSLYTGGFYNTGYSSYGFCSNPAGSSSTGATGSLSQQTDFYVTPNGEVIPASLDNVNGNLSKLENQNGKYVGSDSYGPIRIRFNEIHEASPNFTGTLNPYHAIPHFHIERRVHVLSGKWVETYTGPMEMFY